VDTAGELVVGPTESDQSGIRSNRWKVATKGEVWSCREGVGVPLFDRAKRTPGFVEKNFVRLLIFFACCFW
jgi:hypothetical protein